MIPEQIHFANLLSEQVGKAVARAIVETKQRCAAVAYDHAPHRKASYACGGCPQCFHAKQIADAILALE